MSRTRAWARPIQPVLKRGGPFLEESSKRLTSGRRASLSLIPSFVLSILCNMRSDLTAQKLLKALVSNVSVPTPSSFSAVARTSASGDLADQPHAAGAGFVEDVTSRTSQPPGSKIAT